MKPYRVTKIIQEIKFQVISDELGEKKCFQSEWFTNYLRITVVLCEKAHYGKSLIPAFEEFFASIDKILYW